MYVSDTFEFDCEYHLNGLFVADFRARITYAGTWEPGFAPDVVYSDFEVECLDTVTGGWPLRRVWQAADAALQTEMRRHLEVPAVQDALNNHIVEHAGSPAEDYDDYRYHDAAE